METVAGNGNTLAKSENSWIFEHRRRNSYTKF